MDFTALPQPDVASCPKCGGEMRDVSLFTEPTIKAFRCGACSVTFKLPVFRAAAPEPAA